MDINLKDITNLSIIKVPTDKGTITSIEITFLTNHYNNSTGTIAFPIPPIPNINII